MNDHDTIIEIYSDLKHVLDNQEDFKNTFKDHDYRINKLKSWQNKATGIAITVSVMIPVSFLFWHEILVS